MVSFTHRHRSRILGPVAKAFDWRVDECGPTAQGVYWKHEDGQNLRFEILLKIVDPTARAVTINDFGGGYGALFDRLADEPAFEGGRYYGYDISGAMIATAKDRIGDLRAEFIRSAKATRKADYSFVSGTYNMKMNAPAHIWRDYVFESLGELWERTEKGLAFNMLQGTGAERPGGLYYASARDFFDFCTRFLSPNVEYITDYGLEEWAMLVRR